MKTVKLGDVCEVIAGQSPVGSSYNDRHKGIEFHQGKKLFGENDVKESNTYTTQPSKIAEPGDILMSVRAPVGPVNYTNRKICIGRGLAAIRVGAKIDKSYLFHFLRMNEANINGTEGATFASINKKDIESIKIPLLSLEEQRRVVERLDAAFEKIDCAIELTEKNINNVQILFSKLIEQEIDKTKDYSIVELGEVCEFVRGPFGGSLRKELFKPTGYAVYEQRHAIYGDFRLVRYHIDAIKFSEMKRFEIKPGDVIMSCSGTMGKTSLVPDGIEPGVINQALLKLSPKRDRLLASYLKYWMESRSFQDLLGINSGGAAIKNVASVKILKAISMRLPPIRVQEHIVHSIGALQKRESDMGELYGKKHEALHSLKQSLLTQAFSQGEVE